MSALHAAPPARRSGVVGATLAATLLLYGLVGFWPLAFVEGDDAAIVNGALDPRFAYSYPFQPGTNLLMRHVSSGFELPPSAVLATLSLVGAGLFVLATATFVSRWTGAALAWCLVALLAMPETLSSAYFGNGTVPALGLVAAGLMRLTVTPGGLVNDGFVGVLFGTAAWLRVDSALTWPALLLLPRPGGRGSRALVSIVMALITALALFSVSGVWWRDLLGYTARVVATPAPTASGRLDTIVAWAAFFPLLPFSLTLLGLATLRDHRQRQRLGPIALCLVVTLLPWIGVATSPKHLYASLPFVVVLVVEGVQSVLAMPRRWRALGLSLLAAAGLQYPLGLSAPSGFFAPRLEPTIAQWGTGLAYRAPITAEMRPVAIVLGPGGQLATADSWRPLTGLIFGPGTWHHRKLLMSALLERLRSVVRRPTPGLVVLADSWLGAQLSQNALLSQGCTTDHPILIGEGQAEWFCARDSVRLLVRTSCLPRDQVRSLVGDAPASVLVLPSSSDPGPPWMPVFRVLDPAVSIAVWESAPRR